MLVSLFVFLTVYFCWSRISLELVELKHRSQSLKWLLILPIVLQDGMIGSFLSIMTPSSSWFIIWNSTIYVIPCIYLQKKYKVFCLKQYQASFQDVFIVNADCFGEVYLVQQMKWNWSLSTGVFLIHFH